MICRLEGEVIQSRIDPCGICGKCCTKCDQWIHGGCSKWEKVTPSAARFFVCAKCDKGTNGAGEVQQKIMCNQMETVKGFCYVCWMPVDE